MYVNIESQLYLINNWLIIVANYLSILIYIGRFFMIWLDFWLLDGYILCILEANHDCNFILHATLIMQWRTSTYTLFCLLWKWVSWYVVGGWKVSSTLWSQYSAQWQFSRILLLFEIQILKSLYLSWGLKIIKSRNYTPVLIASLKLSKQCWAFLEANQS